MRETDLDAMYAAHVNIADRGPPFPLGVLSRDRTISQGAARQSRPLDFHPSRKAKLTLRRHGLWRRAGGPAFVETLARWV